MNEVFRTRLVGLAVLLSALFLLSLLLPKDAVPEGGSAETTVSLVEPLSGAERVSAPQPAAASESAPPAPAPPAPPSATREAPAISALADETPVVEHASAAAPAAAPLPRPPPATPPAPKPAVVAKPEKPVAAKGPVETAKAEKPPAEKPKAEKPKAEQPKPAASTASVSPPRPVAAEPGKSAAAKPAAAAKAPEVPAPVAKAPASGAGWYVQIGSYSDPGNAETIVSLLKPLGYRIESARIVGAAKQPLYRVRLGAFATESEARQALQRVARQGYPQSRVVSEAAAKG